MRKDQLHYFLKLAKHENFHHAAEELNVPVNRIFDSVKSLEKELNVRLYETVSQRVQLNLQGRYLVPRAKEMLKINDDLLKMVPYPKFLHYFLELSKLENMQKAAEHFKIEPPSLHYSMKVLESLLGVKLYHKVGRNLRISDEGKRLIPKIKKALRQEEKILKIASLVKDEIRDIA